jgi:uncharacterized protein (TIGR02118 family)
VGVVIKLVYLVTKKAGMSEDAFIAHWTTTHARLASSMLGLLAYSINTPSSLQRGPRPCDGYAMLRFPSYEAAKQAWETPAGRATARDGELFMDSAKPLIVDERTELG